MVGGIIPIVDTCIRREHSGTGKWVIATMVHSGYVVAAQDDHGRAETPDHAVWDDGFTVTSKIETPSTICNLAFPYPHTPDLPPKEDYLRLLARMKRLGHLVMLHTTEQERIPAAYVRYKGARLTVLYSHGNGADIDSCWEVARAFSKELGVNVLA